MASPAAAVTAAAAATQMAGGGLGDRKRSIKVVQDTVLPHLKTIFANHAGPGKTTWTKDQTIAFLNDVQRHDPYDDTGGGLLAYDELDFDKFLAYMKSAHSALSTPAKPTDLSWPLSSYFISSSHNTYLSGNQLYSDSTTESYTNVLLRGCRCVEIDVWNGDGYDTDTTSSVSSSDDERTKAIKLKNQAAKAAREKAEANGTSDSGANDATGGNTSPQKKRLSRIGTFKDKLTRSISTRLKRVSSNKALDGHKRKDSASVSTAVSGPDEAADPTVAPGVVTDEPEQMEPGIIEVEPRVLHGHTLTKEITFRDVCNAIRKSAFTVTDTPLIVSLEVHCNAQQQGVMVKIMKETWGDVLVAEPGTEPEILPSPAELKNKILVKVKYAAPEAPAELVESSEDERAPSEVKKPTKRGKPVKPAKTIQDLSRLGIYTKGFSFKDFNHPDAKRPTHIFSLSESKFLNHHEKNHSQLWEHNKRFMMRAYPAGFRIRSSNLNPSPFWGSGTQIVALNWQETDEGMMLNEGMFAGTGGYVLKPRGFHPQLEGMGNFKELRPKKLTLSITFLAAQNIPFPPSDSSDKSFDPYIKVELHVDASDGLRGGLIKAHGQDRDGEFKARTKTRHGSNVDLGGEKVEFKEVPGLLDELTFVRFTVRDNEIGKDELAAWQCVRLDRLGVGYRFLHLLDAQGKLTEGVVLIKVQKKLV